MKRNSRNKLAVIGTITGVVLIPFGLFAQSQSLKQTVDITIFADMTGTGKWAIPTFSQNSLVEIDNYSNYGATGLMSYQFVKAANDYGPLEARPYGAGVSVQDTFKNNEKVNNLFITYNFSSGLTSPLPIYEMFVATGANFFQPEMKVHFPAGWKLLSSWPVAQVQGQTATITYPVNTSYVLPALLVFQPATIPTGSSVTQIGRYTVIGSTANVAQLVQAINRMSFVEDLFMTSLGQKLPDSIILYAADLSNVNVGYEAIALAARPNLILYNKDILEKQSTEMIETTLIHEIAHLVEANQEIFKGSTYIAPWFKEGIAVFVENLARPHIFSDTKTQALADITRQTHIFTASELQGRENKPFDYLFSGSISSSVSESYSLAGVVMRNFFERVGVNGMQQLFTQLKNADSAQLSGSMDSDRILNVMSGISNLTREEILSPFKSSKNFSSDSAKLVRIDYGQAGDDAAIDYIQHKIPSYIDGQLISSSVTTSAVPLVSTKLVSASVAKCPTLTRNLTLGSSGSDVLALQNYLANAGILKAAPSGYFGALTKNAVIAYQKNNGLEQVGNIGPKTRASLMQSCKTN